MVRHCGPASATVRIDGHEQKISGGRCVRSRAGFVFNVGSSVVDLNASPQARAAVPYVGIVAGDTPGALASARDVSGDGTWGADTVVLSVTAGHLSPLLTDRSLTLTDGRSAGTFRGRSADGHEVSGSFQCR